MNDHVPATYTVGELVHFQIGSDVYPAVVTKVTAKTVTVAKGLRYRLIKRVAGAEKLDRHGVHLTQEDVIVDVTSANMEHTLTFRVTKSGLTHKNCYFLGHGFEAYSDPSF
jgi:hypothetical protein